MTDLRQAAQQVLDAWDDPVGMKDLCVAMDALRTALEQQAEPDRRALQAAGTHPAPCARHCEAKAFEIEIRSLKSRLKQQAEPVAYFDFQELKFSWAKHMKIGPVPVSIKVEPMKLYTAPPQRKWVGLTDEDFLEACQIAERGNYLLALQRIQIKLKERNT